MTDLRESRFILLHALAVYHAVLPEGVPVRTLNSRIDAVERCRLSRTELDDAIQFLTSHGIAEQVDGKLRLTPDMASRIPTDARARPTYDRAGWPPMDG
jgi:hypothetical protein